MVNTVQVWLVFLGLCIVVHYLASGKAYRMEHLSFGAAFLRGFAGLWAFVRVAYIVPCLATIVAWVWHGRTLLHYRYIPEQQNHNWPPPYQAVDVTQVGMLTPDNADLLLPEPEPEQPPQRTVRVVVDSPDERQERIAFLPDLPEVRQFARMAANGQTFSLRTAERARLGRDDWRAIRDTFLDRGWAVWRDEREKRQGLQLTHVGRAVLRYVGAGK